MAAVVGNHNLETGRILLGITYLRCEIQARLVCGKNDTTGRVTYLD